MTMPRKTQRLLIECTPASKVGIKDDKRTFSSVWTARRLRKKGQKKEIQLTNYAANDTFPVPQKKNEKQRTEPKDRIDGIHVKSFSFTTFLIERQCIWQNWGLVGDVHALKFKKTS